jgi:DNA-binding NarL/FixJ family response regulator
MAERGVPRDSAQGDILDDYEKGMTVAEIAKARKMSESHVFKTVTETVIDPKLKGYRPTTPQPKKEVEAFVTDDELESSWNALSDTEKKLVRDVINKTPGAMDEFNQTKIPMDMLIWAAQNGISGKMGAPKRFAERDASIIEQYKAGQSLADIAREAGVTQNAVTQVLNMARKRGIIGKPRSGVARSEDIPRNQKIVELYESGKSYAEIARELGLTTNVVYNAVLKSGKMKPIKKGRGPGENGVSGRMAMPADGGFKKYRSPEDIANMPTFRGKPWEDVEESLGGEPWPFESQSRQFDEVGPPGLSYFKGTGNGLKKGQWVDCLLWRDDSGKLKGIVYHYPQDLPLEKKGNMNVFISPDSKRQGIASKLVAEAIKRYKVDLRQQRYSEEGAAFINNFVRNMPENKGKL